MVPEEHLHLFETVPVEGQDIEDIRESQTKGLVVVRPFFAATDPQGVALGGVLHHQLSRSFRLAEPAGARG